MRCIFVVTFCWDLPGAINLKQPRSCKQVFGLFVVNNFQKSYNIFGSSVQGCGFLREAFA